MKKALSLFLSIVLVLGVFLSVPFTGSPFNITAEAASSGTCGDNLTWTLDDNGVLTISGTGAMTNYSYPSSVPWYSSSSSIKEVVINGGVTSIGDEAFYGCLSLTSITIPDGVTRIGACAFQSCTSLISITIPDSVMSIGNYAFYCCDSLTSITIPDGVTSIGNDAFYSCDSLTSINVSSSNQYFTSVDGVLFNKNKTKLIQYPLGKTNTSYTIPKSVTSIGDSAFDSCNSLTSITIGDGVTSIGDYAFYDCESLASITLPDSVTSIGAGAFFYCTSLSDVYYSGSSEDWSKISIESYNGELLNATIHYTCWIIDKAATCTVAGSRHKACTVCGKTLETQTISATGHTSSDWITDKAATVNAAGSKYKRCTVCGNTLETAVIPQLTCAAPTLSSVMNANGGVTVTWKAVSGADSYRVYRKTSSSDWSSISSKVTSTSYIDKAAKSGTTYYYTVKAENEAGLSEYNSTGISIKHLAMPTVTVANDATGVKVSWNKIAGATGYYVYRKANGEWTRCATISDGSTVSYTDTKVKTGSTYSYSVMAYDSTTTSDYDSKGVSVKHLATPTVTIANAATGVKVSWNKITGASKYYVYRKASGDKEWTRLTTSATGTSYTDTKAKSGTTYYYTVKAISGSVASASKSSSALKYLAMPKVSSLSNANSGITVKWGKITGAKGYTVYRKASGDKSWTNLGNTTSTSFTDKKAKAGTTYYYTVKAYNGSVKSTYTASSAIRRLTTPTLKSVSSAKSGITFKWNKVTGASGYYVYRKTGSGSWQKIATVKSGSTVSYLDKTAKKGTSYTYTVKAYYSSSVSYYNTTGLKIKDKY